MWRKHAGFWAEGIPTREHEGDEEYEETNGNSLTENSLHGFHPLHVFMSKPSCLIRARDFAKKLSR
jgi:hypothetical protein